MNILKKTGGDNMIKKISFLLIIITIVLSLTSCKSYSVNNIHELIKILNSEHQRDLRISDFLVEKNENIIYRKMTEDKNLISIYCNKNGEIIQCILSAFDTDDPDNYKIMSEIGSVLTNEKTDKIESILKNHMNNLNYSINNWKVYTVKTTLGIAYVIKQENSEDNSKPSLKNKID